VLNLAINARDAMPQGGNLRLETMNSTIDADMARLEKGLAPGDYIRLSVSDTGVGMSPEIIARVFEPFFTTKAPGKGTGLGLATIFGFVTQSNGHVSVYSEVGEGTTIHIYLPRLTQTSTRQTVAESILTSASGGDETILLVEDDAALRAAVRKELG